MLSPAENSLVVQGVKCKSQDVITCMPHKNIFACAKMLSTYSWCVKIMTVVIPQVVMQVQPLLHMLQDQVAL